MSSEERLDRIERALDRHIEFVGRSLAELSDEVKALAKQVNRTAAAGEETEKRLQELIRHVDGIDGRVKKLEDQ